MHPEFCSLEVGGDPLVCLIKHKVGTDNKLFVFILPAVAASR